MNTVRTFSLPSEENETLITTVTALPKNLVLTNSELAELVELESIYEPTMRITDKILSQFNIKETANQAIHCFLVENNFGLRLLVTNPHLSKENIEILLDKTEKEQFGITEIKNDLLQLPHIHANAELYKMIYNKIHDSGIDNVIILLFAFRYQVCIDVLMFGLEQSYLKEKYSKIENAMDGMRLELKKTIKDRPEELAAWIKEKNPELASYPDAWVLKAYNFID